MARFTPNEEQLKAIECLAGPLVVTAGAGSGKTSVLAQRFVKGIEPDGGVPGWDPAELRQVLAITYTDRAAGELAERVRRACLDAGLIDEARSVDEAWISTIHGFCSRLLRRHALEIGLDPGFRISRDVENGALRDRLAAETLAQAYEETPGVHALIETYGWAVVASAVQDAYDRSRAMGASALELTTPLRPERPGETAELAERMGDVYRSVVQELPGLADSTTMWNCVSQAQRGIDELASAGEVTARTLQEVHMTCEFKAGNGRHKERALELLQELDGIMDRVVEIMCADFATALIEAATRFEAAFASAKRASGLVDFEDLQLLVRDALRDDERLARRYSEEFRLVMIDEFQDTNQLQTAIVRSFAGNDLCTVGDENQSIYAFRFADVDVFREYVAGMVAKGAETVSLAANYRSHRDIIEFVNAVFSSDALFGEELTHLVAGRTESGEPTVWDSRPRLQVLLVDDSEMVADEVLATEAEWIAEQVAQLVAQGRQQSEVAVLMRTLRPMASYEAAMRRRGLRVAVAGGGDFFGDMAVAVARMLIRAIANLRDDEAVAALLAGPMVGMTPAGLLAVRRAAAGPDGVLWDGLTGARLSDDDEARARTARRTIEAARSELGALPLSAVILGAVERLGHDVRMLACGLDGEHAYANTLKLARLADAFEATGGSGIYDFMTWLEVKELLGDREAPASVADDSTPAVRFLTVHASKGLEFPVVVLPRMGSDIPGDRDGLVVSKSPDGRPEVLASLPRSFGKEAVRRRPKAMRDAIEARDAAARAEFKRLFYVGCTRAREALILSGASDLTKPSGRDLPTGWLREALDAAGPIGPGVRQVPAGNAAVEVIALYRDSECPWVKTPTVVPSAVNGPDQEVEGETRDPSRAPEPGPALVADRNVSYTRLDTYRKCGRRFMLQNMARIGGLPDLEGGALGLGDAVHALMRTGAANGAVDEAAITAAARYRGLGEADERRLADAVGTLLASEAVSRALRMEKTRPEAPFAVLLHGPGGPGDRDPVLSGSMDLVGMEGDRALVIDYKTGASGAECTDDQLRDRYELQADCYSLAVLEQGAREVEIVFVMPEVTGTDGAPRAVSMRYAASDLPRLRETISAAARALMSGPYERRADYEPGCEHCPAYATPLCDIKGPARGRTQAAATGSSA